MFISLLTPRKIEKMLRLILLYPLLLALHYNLTAQNFNELFNQKPDIDRITLLGSKMRSLLNEPAKLEAFQKIVEEKATEQEKLYLERELDPIHKIENPTFEQQLANAEFYVKKYSATQFPFLQAIAYYTKAVRFRDNKVNNAALENFILCYDALSKDPTGRYYEQSWYLHDIASIYYQFKDFPKAIEIAQKAEFVGPKFSPNADWFELVTPNLVGMAYLKNENYNLAKEWLSKTYDRAVLQNNEYWIGIAGGNIGNTFYMNKRYAEAVPYFKTAIEICKKLNLWDNISAFSVNLSDCYLRLGQIESVDALLKQGYTSNIKDPQTEAWLKYYKVASSYYKLTKNNSLAFQYDDSTNVYEKKLAKEYDLTKKARIEADWSHSKVTLEKEIEIQKARREKWILYGVLSTAILLSIIGAMYFKRQKHYLLTKQERLEIEKSKAIETLSQAQSQLHEFKENIQQKNEVLTKLSSQVKSLQRQNETITNDQITSIEALKQSAILTPEDWNNFKILFNKGYPGYLNKLEKEFSEFTPAETRYILLLKLNLSTREMATMLGVSIENIRNIRFRVKKKMKMEDAEEMDEKLKNLL
jgi:tetratricopeptide (TPR) repeat protein